MALPVLAGLKHRDPFCHITFFVEDGYEGGLINSRFCDRIFKFNRKSIRDSIKNSNWVDGVKELREIISDLKNEEFSEVINLSQHPYIAYVVSVLDRSVIKGRQILRTGNQAIRDNWSQYLYAIPFAREYNKLHATDVYKRVAAVSRHEEENFIKIGPEERTEAARQLAGAGINPYSRIAVLQPGAAYAVKRWPVGNFTELGKMLVRDGYWLIVTGAPAEREIAESIASQLGSACFSFAGRLSFRETVALVDFCEICITADTALMHAASALRKRVFSLFGPTNPVETGPYGDGHLVFSGRCNRRPCFCFECRTQECMKSITPEDVYAGINGSLTGKAGCDVYRSAIGARGDYELVPVTQNSVPYYDRDGASIIQKCFDPEYQIDSEIIADEKFRVRAEEFCNCVLEVETALGSFLKERKIEHIRRYDEIRQEMNKSIGINAFWNAVLNIKLNSIPIINATESVIECQKACRETRLQIAGVFENK